MPRAENWTIADLLDFEYLLGEEKSGEEGAASRDRAIFATEIAPHLPPARQEDRRFIFKRWLASRRSSSPATLPGQHYRSAWQALLTLAILLGLSLGAGVASGLLNYRGDEPVNVAWFFAATVGVQWLLLLLAGALWLVRKLTGLLDDFRPLQALMGALLWAFNAGVRKLPGEKRESARAVMARITQRGEIYGAISPWPLLIATQLFGVCFNLGVLAALLLHVALTDVAFGWQSTLRTSPEEAFRLVSFLAQPWSFAPDAHPTLDQVVASRFAYSEGIRPLSQNAMASWWPFLCYAVLFYGLLLRVLLLGWATLKLRGALAGITFGHHGCHALFRRLTGPMIQRENESAALQIPAVTNAASARSSGACFVLLAQELTLDPSALEGTLQKLFGWSVGRTLPVQIDHPSGNNAALAELSADAAGLAGVVVVLPARRAPIKAIALFLQKVAAAAGAEREVLVLLTGRAEAAGFAGVTEDEMKHWQNFSAIHGLRVSLESWPAA